MKVNKILFMVSLILLLQACGQTGPLYMPGTPPPVHVPKDVPVEEL